MSSPAVGRLLDRLEEYGVECRIRQMIVTGTNAQALLLERLRHAGIVDVVAVEPATGGLAATAGFARRDDGSCVFVKTFGDLSSEGVFVAEADGLTALNELGGMPTAQVLLAHLHTSTVHPRFGWYEDNWLGRRRQINTWNDDGFAFFAENRLLRWLGSPVLTWPWALRVALRWNDSASACRAATHATRLSHPRRPVGSQRTGDS